MRKARPFIILFLMLGAPIIIVLLLDTGTHHKETIKILSPKYPDPGGGLDSLYHTVGDFSFTSQTGTQITQDSLKGHIYVADVFFTTCPGICPKLSNSLKEVQRYLEESEDTLVKIVSFSVDPETDSVPALQDYAEQYGILPTRWHLLTGNKEDLYEVAHNDYFFKATEDSSQAIRFVHDETLRLIDKEGRIRGDYYNGTIEDEIKQLIDDIKLLKFEYEHAKE